MKKLFALALAASVAPMVFANGPAYNGNQDTANAPVFALIIPPVTVKVNGILSFGKVVVGGPGSVELKGQALHTQGEVSVFSGKDGVIPANHAQVVITKDFFSPVCVSAKPWMKEGTLDVSASIKALNAKCHEWNSVVKGDLQGKLSFSGVPAAYGPDFGLVQITACYE